MAIKIFSSRVGGKVNRSRAGDAGVFLVLLIFAAFMALPLLYLVLQSLKPSDELFMFPPRFYVINPTGKNFSDLFRLMATSWVPFSRYIFNTVFVTVLGTFGHVCLASAAAYPVAKYGDKVPLLGGFGKLVRFSLMFNQTVTVIPSYVIFSALGMVDTYWSIIIPAFALSLGFFLMQSFMSDVPDSLIEAAKVDGAKELRILWSIVLPQVKPAYLTLIIFSVQSLWNMSSPMYIYSEPLKALPYAIAQITSAGYARAGAAAAAAIVMMAVPVIVFVISQSSVVETMAKSGIKD